MHQFTMPLRAKPLHRVYVCVAVTAKFTLADFLHVLLCGNTGGGGVGGGGGGMTTTTDIKIRVSKES